MKIVRSTRENGSRRVGIDLSGKSRTEQHHVNDVNINQIMKRYRRTGLVPTNLGTALYGDFSGAEDFHSAKNSIQSANDQFMELPSDLRTLFKNDPGELLAFISDADNEAEAIEMGLLPKTVPQVEVTEQTAPAAPQETSEVTAEGA